MRCIFACALIFSAANSLFADDAPSFRNEVLPIFSRAGCNGGGCHGALAGKGGFRLSLFGYDPESDYRRIAKEARGRRIELNDPGRSLILTKPTTAVKHKGGLRIARDSEDYKTIARWLAAGAPPPSSDDPVLLKLEISPAESTLAVGAQVQLRVRAEYSDGSSRDVSHLTRFTSTEASVATVDEQGKVQVVGSGGGAITAWFSSRIVIARVLAPFPNKVDAAIYARQPRSNFIDDHVLEQLARLQLPPSESADDATLIRRTYVDTIGRLPTPEETRAYLADESTGKFESLIDELLGREEFVDFWTYKLCDILLLSGAKLRPDALKTYYRWVRERVAENVSWADFVRGIVTAKGSSIENGATNFYAVHQTPEEMAENVSQAFLSLSINCAKCHNHPLEKWTNDQYYSFANIFARVRAKGWGGDARNGNGHRTLYVDSQGELIQPRTGKPIPPAPLDAPPIQADDQRDRREVLADWLTDPKNPYFARAFANRVWANFMGIGLVEPVDDLRVSNPATNEALLSALAEYFVQRNYDMRELIRFVLTSQSYRRSSRALPGNSKDERYYSRFYPRRLMAEVLSDAIGDVTGVRDRFTEVAMNDGSASKTSFYPPGTRAIELFDAAVKSKFLKTFGRNAREITCECERSNQPSLVQALHLSNGDTINSKLAAAKGRVSTLLESQQETSSLIEEIWLLCLSRKPTARELASVEGVFKEAADSERREIVEDVFWSLLTSREFLFQH